GIATRDPVTGEITYTPNVGFIGTDTLTYIIKDLEGNISNIATVIIEVDGPDLTPSITLVQNNFAASVTKNFTVQLFELSSVQTTEGTTRFSVTVPTGYSIGFDPGQSMITIPGNMPGTLAVTNSDWELVSTQLSGRRLVFQAKPG